MEERSGRAVFVLPSALILPPFRNGIYCRLWRRNLLVEINPLKPRGPVVTIYTARFNIQQFSVLPTQCVYVFCVDLRTNSDYCNIQYQLTGLYSREDVCSLRGTDCIFKYNS